MLPEGTQKSKMLFVEARNMDVLARIVKENTKNVNDHSIRCVETKKWNPIIVVNEGIELALHWNRKSFAEK